MRLVSQENLKAPAHDVKRLILPGMHVRRRSAVLRNDCFELEERVVRFFSRDQERVKIPRPPDRRCGAGRPEDRLGGLRRQSGLVAG
jgi:hypothetical protein